MSGVECDYATFDLATTSRTRLAFESPIRFDFETLFRSDPLLWTHFGPIGRSANAYLICCRSHSCLWILDRMSRSRCGLFRLWPDVP